MRLTCAELPCSVRGLLVGGSSGKGGSGSADALTLAEPCRAGWVDAELASMPSGWLWVVVGGALGWAMVREGSVRGSLLPALVASSVSGPAALAAPVLLLKVVLCAPACRAC